ncbi:MAG: redoxin domain-containing protein [Gaiellaceae bacterium]
MRVLTVYAHPSPSSFCHAVLEQFTHGLADAGHETGFPAHLDTVRGRAVALLDPAEDLNFRHFRMRHMVAELLRTGLPPGSEAPDFELPCTDGTLVRLSDLRGQPVLLHFISYTCPVTRGGVSTMRELHRLYGGRVQFVEVLVRQAHPGERHGAYRVYETKLEEARGYQHEEATPWSVLVDDLAGTVQCAYGGLAAAVYLIDSQGTVAFCGAWGQAPALRHAIDDLLARDGTGAPAGKGTDRRPHLAAAIVAGQGGPIRGGRQALIDLELGFPGAMLLMTIGRVARPVLAPLALRTTPVPRRTRVALAAAALGVSMVVCSRMRRGCTTPSRCSRRPVG